MRPIAPMFRRIGDELVARFTPADAEVLRVLLAEFAALLSNDPDPDDPAVERLFPDVYPEDPVQEAEFRRFTEEDLRSGKLNQARIMLTDLVEGGGTVFLGEEKADVWLRALTDLRLVLGTRLGVDDDTDIEAEIDAVVGRNPTSPLLASLTVYSFLGEMQQSLVDALMD
jgi:hypothetical protein